MNTLAAGLGSGFGLDGSGLRGFCGGWIRFVIGDEAATERGKYDAEEKLGFDGAETTLGRMLEYSDDGIDDWSARENDGHDDGRSAFGAEGEQYAESADSAGDTSDKGPEHAGFRIVPIGTARHQDEEWGENGGQEVSDSDEEEGFVAAIDGVLHTHLAGVEEDAVNAPGHDGQ